MRGASYFLRPFLPSFPQMAGFKLQDENRVNYLIAGFLYVGIRATWAGVSIFSNVCSQHCPQIDAPALRT